MFQLPIAYTVSGSRVEHVAELTAADLVRLGEAIAAAQAAAQPAPTAPAAA